MCVIVAMCAKRFAGMTAIYFQKTNNGEIEYRLVELTTIREALLRDYKLLEKAVLERRRIFDDNCVFELIESLNRIREATLNLFEQIIEWQKMFVHPQRPNLLNKDYLFEIVTSLEFLNSSKLRKHLNFAVMRGNLFALPLSTGKPKDPVPVSSAIMKEIDRFSNPDMDRLIAAYSLLQRSLPKKKFQDVLSLNRWVHSIWTPNVQIVTANALPSLPHSRPRSAPSRTKKQKSPLKQSSKEPLANPSLQEISSPEVSEHQLPPHSRSLSQPSLHPSSLIAAAPQRNRQDLALATPHSHSLKSSPLPSSRRTKGEPRRSDLTVRSAALNAPSLSSASSQLSAQVNEIALPSLSALTLSTSQLREWYQKNHQTSDAVQV
jgi:hypothetical protein